MAKTKKLISDSVLYKLAGGSPDTSFPVDERDIWVQLEKIVNASFKLRHFDTTLNSGESIPEAAMIATYEGITVTTFAEKSKSTLPITPIYLPKNMGIFQIYDPNYPDMPFIPFQRGQRGLLRTDELLNDCLGLISYEPKNNVIIYNRDLTTIGITAVTMELCVLDIAQYGVNDILPIPADMEAQIEDELLKAFIWVTAESGVVNNFSNINQTQPKQ